MPRGSAAFSIFEDIKPYCWCWAIFNKIGGGGGGGGRGWGAGITIAQVKDDKALAYHMVSSIILADLLLAY